jgi:membrane protein required for colicin V production
MNWLDAPIIIFLGIAAFIGSRNGLTKTALPLAAVVLAVFLAGRFYLSGADYSGSWLSSPSQAQLVSFILIFILVILAAAILYWLARKILNRLAKSKADLSSTVIPIAGIVSGITLAGFFYEAVANWLSTWLKSSTQAAVAAFAIIFIAGTLVITKIFQSLAAMLDKPPYKSFIDKFNGLGGTILGLAIGGLVSGALLTIIAKFYYTSVEATMRGSALASFLLNNFPFVLRILPKEFDIVRHFFG